MGDEDNFMEGGETEAGQDLEVGRKVGFVPAAAIRILRWAAIGIAAIIFIVTVVIITESVLNRGQSQAGYPAASPAYQGPVPIYSYFAIAEIRGRTADTNPTTFIVQVSLGYDLNNKAMQAELVARTTQLEDLVRSYFSAKTSDELTPNNEEDLKAELKERVNRILSSGKVQDIYFTEFNVIPLS